MPKLPSRVIGKRPPGNPKFYKGQRYRSCFEADTAKDLDARGILFGYEDERLPYEQPCVYVSDFKLPLGVLVEAKGYFPAVDRKKMLAVKRAYPEWDIRILFQDAKRKCNYKAPHSLTYGQWATKHGFIWADGVIPDAWILEPKPND